MRRGDLYWVDLEPARGSEANKVRPAVIVSNDAANHSCQQRGRGVISVVPVTSNTARVLPFQVLLSENECGLGTDSKAQAEQVRSITTDRLRGRIGPLPTDVAKRVDAALRTHLAL